MIELEKRFPSVEMLERIALALNGDAPDLFSKASYQTETLEKLHESVLHEIELVIQNRIQKLHETENEGKGG